MMFLKQIFKNVLVPCAAGVAIKNGHTYGANCVKRADELRPSELPIYSDVCCTCREQKKEEPPSQIEETVDNIRKELWVWQDNIRGYRHKFVEVCSVNLDQMKGAVDYLQEESHVPQRAGAITLSGLAGYVWGLRHSGYFRRIYLASCGALAMAVLCYPNEANKIMENVIHEAKKYFVVVYHFIYGETPKMPEWFLRFSTRKVEEGYSSKSDEDKSN